MKTLVVYETLYGNTGEIGEAIGRSLTALGHRVTVGPLTRVTAEDTADVDLLVVGGPTHAHGMSRAGTRATGAHDAKNAFTEPTVEVGVREWLEALPPGRGRFAAAFDTRFDKPAVLTGSAAKGIAKRLEHLGFELAVEPESFFVTRTSTLESGEKAHAAAWASHLAGRTSMVGAAPR